MNMQLRQCLARAESFRLKKVKKKKPDFDWYFWFSKKAKCVKKAWISKFGFKNARLEPCAQPTTARDGYCLV